MKEVLKQLGVKEENSGASTGNEWIKGSGQTITSYSPVDGKIIAAVNACSKEAYEQVVDTAGKAFLEWKMWPSPKRGDIVRQVGDALRKNKESLGKLVSYEMGKSLQEGYGEVQEMI